MVVVTMCVGGLYDQPSLWTSMPTGEIQGQLHSLLGLVQNKNVGALIQEAGNESVFMYFVSQSVMVIFICY